MLFHYMNRTDPFTDSDKRNFIELVKMPEFEYTADDNGNYYNLAAVSLLNTEGLVPLKARSGYRLCCTVWMQKRLGRSRNGGL